MQQGVGRKSVDLQNVVSEDGSGYYSGYSYSARNTLLSTSTEDKRGISENALSQFAFLLRFDDPVMERSYVDSARTDPRAYLVFGLLTSSALAAGTSYFALANPSRGLNIVGQMFVGSSISMFCVNSISLYLWRSKRSALFKERTMVLLVVIWGQYLLFWGDTWRVDIAFNGGRSSWQERRHYSDVFKVVCMCVITSASASLFRIRAKKVAGILLYYWLGYLAVCAPPGLCLDTYHYAIPVTFGLGMIFSIQLVSHGFSEKEDRIKWHMGVQFRMEQNHLLGKLEPVTSPYMRLLENLEKAVEEEDKAAEAEARSELESLTDLPDSKAVDDIISEMKARQSKERGVAVSYLLHDEFLDLATRRSDKSDPSFHELRDAFFLCDHSERLGFDRLCPRDGKSGCAFVDLLPPNFRGRCTHFLSWTWHYKLSVVRSGLAHWLESIETPPHEIFLFCCFFVNNQYRILYTPDQGADVDIYNLSQVFGRNLQRIGRMVALLDTFDAPKYLTRVWTIFEQFTAVQYDIPVTIIMPPRAAEKLHQEIDQGKAGIHRVIHALCNVDSENAEAFSEDDANLVKHMIEDTVGFEIVNDKVISHLLTWVGSQVLQYMKDIVSEAKETIDVDRVTRMQSKSIALEALIDSLADQDWIDDIVSV